MKKCTLNTRYMENLRKDKIYQTVIIDLALLGKISTGEAKLLLGYDIPNYIQLPNGQRLNTAATVKSNTAATATVATTKTTTSDAAE